jgi:hypothetical protein
VRAVDEREDAGAGEPAHDVAAERHVLDHAVISCVDDLGPRALLVARLLDDPFLEADAAVDVAHRDLEVDVGAAAGLRQRAARADRADDQLRPTFTGTIFCGPASLR